MANAQKMGSRADNPSDIIDSTSGGEGQIPVPGTTIPSESHNIETNLPPDNESKIEAQELDINVYISQDEIIDVQRSIATKDVLNKIKEINNKIQETRLDKEWKLQDFTTSIEKMEWEPIYDIASDIIQDYTTRKEELKLQMQQIQRKLFIWQETAFIKDSHVCSQRLNDCSEYIFDKEQFLEYKNRCLQQSVDSIRNTIERLPQ